MTPDRTRRDAIARNLCARLCDDRRSEDELRVIDLLLGRIEKGADDYGPLVLAGDPRDFGRELGEELLDVAIYGAILRLVARDRPQHPLVKAAPLGGVMLDFDLHDIGGEG